MIKIKRTQYSNPDFQILTKLLDKELYSIYGSIMDHYNEFTVTEGIKHVLIAYNDLQPVGCVCFKYFSEGTVEFKRLFVLENFRGKGVAEQIINELEIWAKEAGYDKCVLESGTLQPEATRLFEKRNYQHIPNLRQYIGDELSYCMGKNL
jgi:putative acetyltransferase